MKENVHTIWNYDNQAIEKVWNLPIFLFSRLCMVRYIPDSIQQIPQAFPQIATVDYPKIFE